MRLLESLAKGFRLIGLTILACVIPALFATGVGFGIAYFLGLPYVIGYLLSILVLASEMFLAAVVIYDKAKEK